MKTLKIQFGSTLVILVIVFAQFAFPSPAYAAGIVVTTLVDEDTNNASCSLREAIIAANTDSAYNGCPAGSGPDAITYSGAAGTLTLGSTLPLIDSDISIDGGGTITISGGGGFRLFLVNSSATLDLNGLTLSNGSLSAGTGGGAIYTYSGATLNITDSTFSNNSSGVAIDGGGAIYNQGALTISGSTFSQNTAAGNATDGGAILSVGASSTLSITNSTFYGNSAGVSPYTNSTGGAINIRNSDGPNTITHVTISDSTNDANYGAFDVLDSNVDLSFSILANSTSGSDCTNRATFPPYTFISTNNLIETDGSNLAPSCSYAVTGDPSLDLGGLQDNGGPTQTLALLPGSIAIDALADSLVACGAATDQRGINRPVDGNGNGTASCDLGAYEFRPVTTTTITQDNPDPSVVNQTVTVNFTVTAVVGTPTGNVTVTDSVSAASCTATVAVGTCNLTLTTLGTRTLTATYAGNINFASSTSAGVPHTVSQASTTITSLPATGFPMDAMTDLPSQPAYKAYNGYGDLWLEIPKLGLKMSIVGVPQTEDGWDVTWLGTDAGYLQGTAFPTWKGNTVISAHVWDAFNNPGPFAKIKNLLYGDQVKIHAFGQIYVYEVRESRLVSPSNVRSTLKHENLDWVTLLTCEGYNLLSKNYSYRRAVRAVLISVTAEK